MATVPLISDEPSLDIEHLPERRKLLDQIGRAIAEGEPPLVLGVHGDWGSGKTSFLHRLQHHLTGECPQNPGVSKLATITPPDHIVAVWFEAWRYQSEANPLVALLHEMRAQLTYKTHTLERLKSDVVKYGSIAVESTLLAFDNFISRLVSFGAGGEKTGLIQQIATTGEKYAQQTLSSALPAAKLRHHLEEILGQLLPKGTNGLKPRLVVFIDDLDRCEAEVALRLLEAIKVFLNLPNCVFVLGLNQREVERSLAKVMPSGGPTGGSGLATRAQEYLEKICGNVWTLPRVSPKAQVKLLRTWLEPTDMPQSWIDAVVRLVEEHDFLPANARRLKTFANALLRYYMTLLAAYPDAPPSADDAALICQLVCIQQFHPRLWRILEGEPDFFAELQGYALGTLSKQPTAKDALRRADDLHPELVELELPAEIKVTLATATAPRKIAPLTRYADRAYGNVLHSQKLLTSFPLDIVPDVRRLLL